MSTEVQNVSSQKKYTLRGSKRAGWKIKHNESGCIALHMHGYSICKRPMETIMKKQQTQVQLLSPSASIQGDDRTMLSCWQNMCPQTCRIVGGRFLSQQTANYIKLLLMEDILHQLIGSLSHYLQGFIHPRWCKCFVKRHVKSPTTRKKNDTSTSSSQISPSWDRHGKRWETQQLFYA